MSKLLPYAAIPRFIGFGNYQVSVFWRYLETNFQQWEEMCGLDLDPPYQRGHVWTEAQQKAYVEFVIRGGQTGKVLLFNCPGWNGGDIRGPIELVDGKQRLTAVLRFLHNEITVLDDFPGVGPVYAKDFEVLRDLELRFEVFVNGLETRAEVLQWYLELNAGGTVHTQTELDKVRDMLLTEK